MQTRTGIIDVMALTPMSAREAGSAAAGGFARRQCAPVAGPSSKNAAGLLAVAFVVSCCHLKQGWTTFVGDSVARGDTTIPVRAGAGKIVSGGAVERVDVWRGRRWRGRRR